MNRLQGVCRDGPECVRLKLRLRLEVFSRMPAVLGGIAIITIPIRRYDDYGLRTYQGPPFIADARVSLVRAAADHEPYLHRSACTVPAVTGESQYGVRSTPYSIRLVLPCANDCG